MKLLLLLLLSFCSSNSEEVKKFPIQKTESEWKTQLSEEAFKVLRNHGTERPFTGKFHDSKEKGIYTCAACNQKLFSSETKFDSGTGWPSFYDVIGKKEVGEKTDTNFGMKRTEVHCSRCGGHLGHVFNDGPAPTGLRYCINSVSLNFIKGN